MMHANYCKCHTKKHLQNPEQEQTNNEEASQSLQFQLQIAASKRIFISSCENRVSGSNHQK